MKISIPPIYILGLGLFLSIVVFAFIIKQNIILTRGDKSMGYTSYNNSKSRSLAFEVMAFWQKEPIYFNAVKKIVFLDYILMSLYGLTILYGLIIVYSHSLGIWKITCLFSMCFIVTGVLFDALQDNAIFIHLTKNKFADFRMLTRPKFYFIFGSLAILFVGIYRNWKSISA